MEKEIPHKDYWDSLIMDDLTGSISDSNKQELEAWIRFSPENKAYSDSARQIWNSLLIVEKKKTYDQGKAFRLFKERTKTNYIIKQRIGIKRLISYAAVLIPFLFLSYFSYQYFIMPKGSSSIITEVITPKGSKTQLTLEDGSKIWMNSESSIQYATKFSQEERRLRLSGEAYLEVARDEKRPFIVEVGQINVRVLGTRFNINAYEENNEIRVALLEGSVEMGLSGTSPTRLHPTETGLYNPLSNQTEVLEHSTGNAISWIKNHLIFSGENFEQIAQTLERNFNVEINIHNEAIKKNCYFGDFVNDETIEQIFDIMSSNNKFTYTIKGNIINVY